MSTTPADADLIRRLDAWLPQTQCTRCGYPRCRAYAEALARGEADLDQCPPGGEVTVRALAEVLGRAPKPLDPVHGEPRPRAVAAIDEGRCIGCALCLRVCPVDAILGAARQMHAVLAAECTGCELCLPPCPVDCIRMVAPATPSAGGPWPDYSRAEADRARARTEARLARLERRARARAARRGRPGGLTGKSPAAIRAEIRAACERARARRQGMDRGG